MWWSPRRITHGKQYSKKQIYAEKLEQNNINIDIDLDKLENIITPDAPEDSSDALTVSGVITDIRTAVINGNSVYFIELDGSGIYYSIKASQQEKVVILNKGDVITVSYADTEGEIISAKAMEKAEAASADEVTE